MSINTWAPDNDNVSDNNNAYTLDMTFLKSIAQQVEEITDLEFNTLLILDKKQQELHTPIMRLSQDQWLAIKDSLSETQIYHLIRFFTLAEVQISGWSAQQLSPVIGLAKILRQQGKPLDKELLLWIKSTSDNRFLPYGPL